MIQFALEALGPVSGEIGALWQRHYDEMGEDKPTVPFAPDWQRYGLLEATGKLVLITARDGNGVMVGYLMAILDTHMHFSTTLFACVDVYYLTPERRGARTALRLLTFADDIFRRLGAQVVLNHAWHRGNQERLLGKLGYRSVETVMSKVITDGR